jgi:hypothetical protein
MVMKNGYPAEIHEATTKDGYILSMHRIPYSPKYNNARTNRPVVFLQHGLFSSSTDWVVLGPDKALGNTIRKVAQYETLRMQTRCFIANAKIRILK